MTVVDREARQSLGVRAEISSHELECIGRKVYVDWNLREFGRASFSPDNIVLSLFSLYENNPNKNRHSASGVEWCKIANPSPEPMLIN